MKLILEDSLFDKIKKFSSDTKKKVQAKRQAEEDNVSYDRASEGIRSKRLWAALNKKPNLSISRDVWVNALLDESDPFGSELYDFLMNSESKFRPEVTTAIIKLFKTNRKLTAELAIDSLDLDNPEYTETTNNLAELIKDTTDFLKKNIFVEPEVYNIYSMLFSIHPKKAKKEVNNLNQNTLETKIADKWKKLGNYDDKDVELLKNKSDIFGPSDKVIELAKSNLGKNEEMFIMAWKQEIDKELEGLKKVSNK